MRPPPTINPWNTPFGYPQSTLLPPRLELSNGLQPEKEDGHEYGLLSQ